MVEGTETYKKGQQRTAGRGNAYLLNAPHYQLTETFSYRKGNSCIFSFCNTSRPSQAATSNNIFRLIPLRFASLLASLNLVLFNHISALTSVLLSDLGITTYLILQDT